ncbi:MAG: DNA recombination protein RmuC [Akkermansia sp.]|nr:DNA recombination protein RmuC [Akkermansia sp.]
MTPENLVNLACEHAVTLILGGLALIFLFCWLLTAVKAAQRKAFMERELQLTRETHARETQELERRWNEGRKAMVAQFKSLAADTLAERGRQLKQANNEQMSAIIKPLQSQLEGLGRAVADARAAEAKNKASLDAVIREMMQQTQKIGTDAVNLTHALKGDSKKQGDWGEMILEQMLENSGLKRGEHYVIQEEVRDENNRRLRPDVVVRFPRERSVVIDSKVSLTAYARYMAADNDTERDAALKEHVVSVRKHVDELATKDYSRVVQDSIGYVLMFIPNEASYIAAVQAQPDLTNEAYRRGVLIVSPTNLLMALQLAFNLWQNEARVQNVEAIFKRAGDLYNKFSDFYSSFEDVGKKLTDATRAFNQAEDRLCRGKGNFVRQVDMLREMGARPKQDKLLKTQDEPTEIG